MSTPDSFEVTGVRQRPRGRQLIWPALGLLLALAGLALDLQAAGEAWVEVALWMVAGASAVILLSLATRSLEASGVRVDAKGIHDLARERMIRWAEVGSYQIVTEPKSNDLSLFVVERQRPRRSHRIAVPGRKEAAQALSEALDAHDAPMSDARD